MTFVPSVYQDAQTYDLLFGGYAQGEDLNFWTGLAQEACGPVLELACGTGRLTIPLAESGVEMTALDLSPTMLALAQQKSESRNVAITWVQGDCRTFSLDSKFGLIFVPANSLTNLLERKSIEDCFRRVREHLTPGGRFAFHLYNPSLAVLTRASSLRYPVGQFHQPDSRRSVVVTHSHAYDAATQVNHILWHYQSEDGQERVASLEMRVFYPQELDALLHYNGFNIIAKYGDWSKEPFTSASRLQLVVCAAR